MTAPRPANRFRPSLHGIHSGILPQGQNRDRERIHSDGGFASGVEGASYRSPGPFCVSYWEDFLGDVVPDQINAIEGTDSATSDCAILAGGMGGVMRLTTGDAGTGLAADMEQITWALQWQASNGDLCMEVRAKMSAITTCYAFIGFTDLAASLEGPVISAASADTITTNATDAVGFMFDTRMATDDWWLVGVANDVDATAQDSGVAPVADTYAIYRIEVDTAGKATFFYNGAKIGSKMSGAVTAGADLTPTICVSKTSVAASMTMDVDYIHVSMERAVGGAT